VPRVPVGVDVFLLTVLEWRPTRNLALRFTNGFGLTSQAVDWGPEVGIVFSGIAARRVCLNDALCIS
jgi:hypothetical protein